MATESANRVAPFWRDLAILMVGFLPAFFMGANYAKHSTNVSNAVPAATVASIPKATK